MPTQQDLTVRTTGGTVLFAHSELADKGEFLGQGKIPQEVLDDLRDLRVAVNRPMSVNSACRSKKRNAEIGGAKSSFHIWDFPRPEIGGACAFDISQTGWTDQQRIDFAREAWARGWSLGLHADFTHIDRRKRYGFPQAWGTYAAKPPKALSDAVRQFSGKAGGNW